MRCIFCKRNSDGSKSIEHIIPESLGNHEHILPKGVVCDGCNNYFAREVEGPLLATIHFLNLRGRQLVRSKRGNVPLQRGFFPAAGIEIALAWNLADGTSVQALRQRDEPLFIRHLQTHHGGTFYVPVTWDVPERLLSRFLAKAGLEILAQRLLPYEDWEVEVIDNPRLDSIRDFARRGERPELWPVHRRRIYDEAAVFDLQSGPEFQVMHEYTLIYTDKRELYAVICIFGDEYTINLGGPEIEGYTRWLERRNGRSALY